eukprot:GHVR01119612.1.p1 GENE.GHVR01119612.1~~GHVR01119612.1.p1  ORF type:complete len:147 (+),score=79.69 GHVR01119612.1:555-995(+)
MDTGRNALKEPKLCMFGVMNKADAVAWYTSLCDLAGSCDTHTHAHTHTHTHSNDKKEVPSNKILKVLQNTQKQSHTHKSDTMFLMSETSNPPTHTHTHTHTHSNIFNGEIAMWGDVLDGKLRAPSFAAIERNRRGATRPKYVFSEE